MIKNYDTILFDLDGTITDSAPGIIHSVRYALKKLGTEVTDNESLYKFIGPPLMDAFTELYHFSEEKASEAVSYYREYYTVKGIFENRVYDGFEDAVSVLRDEGKALIVATSKPEIFAKRILDHFGLEPYFDFVAGAELVGDRQKKADVIRYALEKGAVGDKSSVLMVGDRDHDIIGAKQNGIASLGVLYGFGTREELEAAGADYIVENVEDLKKLAT